uniref:Uncharacterized protein n=1 Tax=viral metagenome TaxID=1070528 RepID=A0A6H1ZYA2_9ZZZZ
MVREKLAAYSHEAWSGWMKYLFDKSTLNQDGTVTIPKHKVERWSRQMNSKYLDLPDREKESDRKEADSMLKIIKMTNKSIILIILILAHLSGPMVNHETA